MPRLTFALVLIIAIVQVLSLAYQRDKNKDFKGRIRDTEHVVEKLKNRRDHDLNWLAKTSGKLDDLRSHVHNMWQPSQGPLPLPPPLVIPIEPAKPDAADASVRVEARARAGPYTGERLDVLQWCLNYDHRTRQAIFDGLTLFRQRPPTATP